MLFVACRTEAPEAAESGPYDGAIAPVLFVDAEPSPIATSNAPTFHPALLAPYAFATAKSGKSVGHTSVVFRIDFDSDAGALRAAYKPESKRGHKRFRGEVAAYRLGIALGLPNVPPAMIRTFKRDVLRLALQNDAHALALFDDEVVDRGGRVFGALMPWIDKLEFTPLESPTEKARWKKWLANGGDLPQEERALAAQISTLVVFDVITGNWDRWSGANVGIDRPSGTLLFVDNDAAFFDPVPRAQLAAQMALLGGIDRYSRSLVARLRTLDPITLADAIGDEETGTPLLAASIVAAADQRRKDVLGVIDSKIAALGEPAVLFF